MWHPRNKTSKLYGGVLDLCTYFNAKKITPETLGTDELEKILRDLFVFEEPAEPQRGEVLCSRVAKSEVCSNCGVKLNKKEYFTCNGCSDASIDCGNCKFFEDKGDNEYDCKFMRMEKTPFMGDSTATGEYCEFFVRNEKSQKAFDDMVKRKKKVVYKGEVSGKQEDSE